MGGRAVVMEQVSKITRLLPRVDVEKNGVATQPGGYVDQRTSANSAGFRSTGFAQERRPSPVERPPGQRRHRASAILGLRPTGLRKFLGLRPCHLQWKKDSQGKSDTGFRPFQGFGRQGFGHAISNGGKTARAKAAQGFGHFRVRPTGLRPWLRPTGIRPWLRPTGLRPWLRPTGLRPWLRPTGLRPF